ncbi:MAG: nucleotidyl transferase AbiEii/AbiGii toxin family protein [Candidatus Omnitrophica bacterium]|nr:nucleotidyl transferase AbiEii/AbiGii toxin family protein [Candidatus Omnitrophota bacterium]
MIDINKIKDKAAEERVSISLVFKEHVHFFVLDYLFKKGMFSYLVFQGGTALRLVYNGLRYSEDLNFVLNKKNSGFFKKISGEIKLLPSYLEKSFSFVRKSELKVQKDTSSFKRYCLILQTDFLPAKDKTNIEIVSIPSYKNKQVILQRSEIPVAPVISVETPQEIFSDKIIAFGARQYLKGRDIWDIHFMSNTMKIVLTSEVIDMVDKKLSDYNLSRANFITDFNKKLIVLKKQGGNILRQEMERFLPLDYRQAFKKNWLDICNDVVSILEKTIMSLRK